MSIAVDLADLADRLAEYGPAAFLVTVGGDGGPHVVSVGAELEDGRVVCGAGRTTAANAREQPAVTLLWPGAPTGEYSLLVDGEATVERGHDGDRVLVAPRRAVLHRLQGAGGDGPACVTVLDRRRR